RNMKEKNRNFLFSSHIVLPYVSAKKRSPSCSRWRTFFVLFIKIFRINEICQCFCPIDQTRARSAYDVIVEVKNLSVFHRVYVAESVTVFHLLDRILSREFTV